MNVVLQQGEPADDPRQDEQANPQFVAARPLVDVTNYQRREKATQATHSTNETSDSTGITLGDVWNHLENNPVTNSGGQTDQDDSGDEEALTVEAQHNPQSKNNDCNKGPL